MSPAPSSLQMRPAETPSPPVPPIVPPIVETPYANKKTNFRTKNPDLLQRIRSQYNFQRHPLGVRPAIVPCGWTWAVNGSEIRKLIDYNLRELQKTVEDRCVMFGSSQLRTWLERSAHNDTYSSDAENIDNDLFPFTIQRCLIISGFHDTVTQTKAEQYSHEEYGRLFQKSVKGGAASRWSSSAQLSPSNPGGVYAVVCSKHIVDNDGLQCARKKCADWFSEYREQSGGNIYAPVDVWKMEYTRELQDMFEQSKEKKVPYSHMWRSSNFGPLKEVHIQLQRNLTTLQPVEMNLSQEM